jgi:hypothetical protein
LIPKRAGDRVKTDRRDCKRLAELSRAGELSAVWVPDPADEAIRDLARAREDAVNARRQVRQQLKAFLLRHEVRYPQRTSWTKTFYRWLATLSFEANGAQTAFTEYWQAVSVADERVTRLTDALVRSIGGWRFEPVVKALQVLRGVDQISALGLVAEIGELCRVASRNFVTGCLTENVTRQVVDEALDSVLTPYAAVDGLPAAGALGTFERRSGGAREHYQGRQWARATTADRGGMELPLSGTHRLRGTAARQSSAAGAAWG